MEPSCPIPGPGGPSPRHVRCEWDDCPETGLPCCLPWPSAPAGLLAARLCPEHALVVAAEIRRAQALVALTVLTEMISAASGQPPEVVEAAILQRRAS